MALSARENYLRTVEMTAPEWIPCAVHVSDASWDECRSDMEDVAQRHPKFFPQVKKGWRNYDTYRFGPAHCAGERFTDAWNCVWLSEQNGIAGVVIESPLDSWDKWESYRIPDPLLGGIGGPRIGRANAKAIGLPNPGMS